MTTVNEELTTCQKCGKETRYFQIVSEDRRPLIWCLSCVYKEGFEAYMHREEIVEVMRKGNQQ